MRIDDLEVNLIIDGLEWGFFDESKRPTGIIAGFTLFLKRAYAVPVLEITIVDTHRLVGRRFLLRNGTILDFEFFRDGLGERYEFMVTKVVTARSAAGMAYSLTAVLHEPKWFLEASTSSYSGTTSEALGALAKECGLEMDADDTNDAGSPWLGYGRERYKAAWHWAAFGWAGPSSIMCLVFCPRVGSRPKSLVYRDLNAIAREPVNHFAYGLMKDDGRTHRIGSKENPYPVDDFSIEDFSGQGIMLDGYNLQMKDQNSRNDNADSTYQKVTVERGQGLLGATGSVRGELAETRTAYGILNSNMHGNCNRALHQNARGMRAMGNRLPMSTIRPTQLRPLDPVHVSLADPYGEDDIYGPLQYEGVHLIEDRIVKWQGNSYSELLVLFRGEINTS